MSNIAAQKVACAGGGESPERREACHSIQVQVATIDPSIDGDPRDSHSPLSNKENIPVLHALSAEVLNEDPATEWKECPDSETEPPTQTPTENISQEREPNAPRSIESCRDSSDRRESQSSKNPAVFHQRHESRLQLYDVHGRETWVHESAEDQVAEMEDYVPLPQGSDGSMLSTTQEHEMIIYDKIRAELANSGSLYASQTQERPVHNEFPEMNREESAKSVPDTSHSYEKGDIGHVGLSYPSVPTQRRFDEDITMEQNSFSQHADFQEPKTPALPKIHNLQSFGIILRGTQMFATTPAQASTPVTGARDATEPSSPRPSPPDLYRARPDSTALKSSPPFQSYLETQDDHVVDLGESSSPMRSFPTPGAKGDRGRQISIYEDRDVTVERPLNNLASGSLARGNAPEQLERYVSRRESQERRQRMRRHFSEDEDSQGSDDDSLAREVERKRHATIEKAKAAKALAAVHISMTPTAASNDDVEVPGTRRRRSLSEEYLAQCKGHDARDTQQDVIADSQSEQLPASIPEKLPASDRAAEDEANILAEDSFGNQSASYNKPMYAQATDIEFQRRTPFEQQTAGDADSGEDEAPTSPLEKPATQTLSGLSTNGRRIRMPEFPSAGSPDTADALIPETSPSEVRPFSAINNDFPPDASIHDSEFGFLMSQDHHPPSEQSSPVRSADRRFAGRLQRQKRSQTGTRSDFLDAVLPNHAEKKGSTPGTSKAILKNSSTASSRGVSVGEETSEYVTAPDVFVSSVLSAPPPSSVESSVDDSRDDLGNVTNVAEEMTAQIRRSGLRSADQVKGPSRLLRKSTSVYAGEGSERGGVEHAERPTLKSKSTRFAPADETGTLNKAQLSSKENEAEIGETVASDNTPGNEPQEREVKSKHPRPMPSESIRGPSRSTRRSAQWKDNVSESENPSRTAPSSTARRETRSSRLSSVNNSERAESDELVDPITPAPSKTSKLATTAIDGKLFANMAFSISYSGREEEKLRILRLIKQYGGQLLVRGFDELFDTAAFRLESPRSSPGAGGESGQFELSLTSEAQLVGFTCLVADEHSRKAKFMQALALGLPCISGRWIEDCVAKKEILDWGIYLLAAGESTFLGGAIRSRSLQSYPAAGAKLAECFKSRQKLLAGKMIMLVMGKGKAEERKRAYLFLTYALGARRVHRVVNNAGAKKALLDAEAKGEIFDWVYVDEKEEDAEMVIFGVVSGRKRKRVSSGPEDGDLRPPKKVRIISDEYVIQSLILGRLIDEA